MEHQELTYFEFHSPETVEQTLELLRIYGSDAKLLAGGTDLIPKLKAKVLHPAHVISLKKVSELNYIHYTEGDGLHIGAMTPIREVENFPVVREKYVALYEGAHAIASTQIRNFGTITGNICNAVPSADSAPGLVALGASVKVRSHAGTRELLVEDLFAGVCKTVLAPDELVTEIFIPDRKEGERSIYYPFTIRRALDLAVAGSAANGIVRDGVVEEIRIALGAVAVKPKRALKAEQVILGKTLTDELIEEAARVAGEEDCAPITDLRATAEYRREIIRIFTRDAIRYVAGMKTDIDMSVEDLRR